MSKKIASEFAIGVVLLVAIIAGGIFWLQSEKFSQENSQVSKSGEALKNDAKLAKEAAEKASQNKEVTQKTDDSACLAHYYEGETEVHGWLASDQQDGSGMVMQIKPEDAKKLPIKDTEALANFTVKLIDPTDEVKGKLASATQENPAKITIRGYAEICQKPPLVSIKQATIAFKKG